MSVPSIDISTAIIIALYCACARLQGTTPSTATGKWSGPTVPVATALMSVCECVQCECECVCV